MLNFHKFGFLDAKKLQRFTLNQDFWLETLNPKWLFIWSDSYKPEIAFENDVAYIRILVPDVGICYYPPLGASDIKSAIKNIKKDAQENGFDFNMTSIDSQLYDKYANQFLDLKENPDQFGNIYITDEIAFMKKKGLSRVFEKNHKDALYRLIKKEDFPRILEFIEKWSNDNKISLNKEFYDKLNSIKKMMEHLYEFDFLGIVLYDEENIYGIAIGSLINNITFLHLCIALDSTEGALEELLICICKSASAKTRYINLGKLELENIKKFKVEKSYSTYRL